MELLVLGATGRMGKIVIELGKEKGYRIIPLQRNAAMHVNPNNKQVCIDFSQPEALMECLPFFIENNIPLITGTTGLVPEEVDRLLVAGKHIPILLSSNFSLGMNLTFYLSEIASKILKMDAEVEITEAHHRYKKDAPSGTALTLGKKIARARGQKLEEVKKTGRSGINEELRGEDIYFHSLRGGNIVGDHSAHFILENETITISHHAADRKLFAAGALACIPFIESQNPGFYTMDDVFKHQLEK